MRRALNFPCAGHSLAATLDMAEGTTGLLIVSGGNEIRCGAHRGVAALAAQVAAEGHPVFRFDRRGIGDSEGMNAGFLSSRDDLTAAIAAFRTACPSMTRIVAFGNCDAASALALHQPLDVDILVLANPWTIEQELPVDDADTAPALPPAGAIKARYVARLRDPASYGRLLRGDIDFGKLARGIARMLRPGPPPASDSLGARVVAAIAAASQPCVILLAERDRTAQAFADYWNAKDYPQVPCLMLASAAHSFAGEDANWLAQRLLEQLSA